MSWNRFHFVNKGMFCLYRTLIRGEFVILFEKTNWCKKNPNNRIVQFSMRNIENSKKFTDFCFMWNCFPGMGAKNIAPPLLKVKWLVLKILSIEDLKYNHKNTNKFIFQIFSNGLFQHLIFVDVGKKSQIIIY